MSDEARQELLEALVQDLLAASMLLRALQDRLDATERREKFIDDLARQLECDVRTVRGLMTERAALTGTQLQ